MTGKFLGLLLQSLLCVGRVIISEVGAHTDTPWFDFIELHNTDSFAVDITGWGFSQTSTNRAQFTFPSGFILGPLEYRSIDLLSQFGSRISKEQTNVYLTDLIGGTYTFDLALASTFNTFTYCWWVASEGDDDFPGCHATQGFASRYPLIGAWVVSEIGLVAATGSCQYVKFTGFRANQGSLLPTDTTYLQGRAGYPAWLRFKDRAAPFLANGSMSPPEATLSGLISGPPGTSFYASSCPCSQFRTAHSLSNSVGCVQWDGTLTVSASSEVVALYVGEGHPEHQWPWDIVKPDLVKGAGTARSTPWPVWWNQSTMNDAVGITTPPPAAGFVMERVSLNTYGNEPRNWRVKGGTDAPCDAWNNNCAPRRTCDPAQGASSCGYIDKCTLSICESTGFCRYTSLACNHPNFPNCYPDFFCGNATGTPAVFGFPNCEINADYSGHGIWDQAVFGYYQYNVSSVPWQGRLYWHQTCTTEVVDCMLSGWGLWSACDCNGTQTRSRARTVEWPAGPGGKSCAQAGALQQSEDCSATCPFSCACLHAGQCTSPPNRTACNCTGTGYNGPLCSVPLSACNPSPCKNAGLCSLTGTGAGFACDCTGTGYTGVDCSVAQTTAQPSNSLANPTNPSSPNPSSPATSGANGGSLGNTANAPSPNPSGSPAPSPSPLPSPLPSPPGASTLGSTPASEASATQNDNNTGGHLLLQLQLQLLLLLLSN